MAVESVVSRLEDVYGAYQPAYGFHAQHFTFAASTVTKGLPFNPRRFFLGLTVSTAIQVYWWFDSTVGTGQGNGMGNGSNWNLYWSLQGPMVTSEIWFFSTSISPKVEIYESFIL